MTQAPPFWTTDNPKTKQPATTADWPYWVAKKKLSPGGQSIGKAFSLKPQTPQNQILGCFPGVVNGSLLPSLSRDVRARG